MDLTQQFEMNSVHSVDLTEDEDSRENILDYKKGNPQLKFEKQKGDFPMRSITKTSPPPLTPIPRLDSIERPHDHKLYNVPKLTKIQTKSSVQQSSKNRKVAKVVSSTVIKTPTDDMILEDGSSKIVQSAVGNQISIIDCSVSQNPPGKKLKIMKNKKIYEFVIPHNVMPLANQTSGPVLINIPEVGSLVITIDPHSRNQVVPKNVQLEPFSLNFDEIIEASDESFKSSNTSCNNTKTSINEGIGTKIPCSCCTSNKTCSSRKSLVHEDLLSDKSFCWQYSKRKRKEQRMLKNLFGFSKVEVRNTKKCSRDLDFHIYRKHCQLLKKRELLGSLKALSTGTKYQMLSDFQNGHDHVLPVGTPPPNNVMTQTSNFDDLLVTKRVVILNEGNVEMPDVESKSFIHSARHRRNHKSKQKRELQSHQGKISDMYEKKIIKPCYINMTKSPHIDQMYLDLTRKINSPKQISLAPERIPKSPKILSYEKMFLSKVIDTIHKFRTEMAFIKPILVLNELNFTIVKYPLEFSKSNIVFAVNKERYFPNSLLNNHLFVTAVQVGYVKLVDADILCSYFLGEFGPQSSRQ